MLENHVSTFYDDFGNAIPISSRHDDFVSFSADLLTKLGYEEFNGSVGTGGLDLLLYTGANGASNAGIAGGPYIFVNGQVKIINPADDSVVAF